MWMKLFYLLPVAGVISQLPGYFPSLTKEFSSSLTVFLPTQIPVFIIEVFNYYLEDASSILTLHFGDLHMHYIFLLSP